MPKIIFWSPQAISVGQTLASIAVSTMMAIEEDYSNILMHGHWQAKKIESAFTYYQNLKSMNVFNSSSIGITALTRLVESNKLTPESIRNYAKPVLKQRLDIMYGTNVTSREQFVQLTDSFPAIVQKATESYDLVWVDLPKSTEKTYITNVLSNADIVLCTINQEEVNLEETIRQCQEEPILKDKQKIFLICDYEDRSKYNITNIKRRFGIKDQIMCIPHNFVFADACSEGTVVDFFYKNLGADKNDYNGRFIYELRNITKKVLDKVKI